MHELLSEVGHPVSAVHRCDAVLQLHQRSGINQDFLPFAVSVAHPEQIVIIIEEAVKLLFLFGQSRYSLLRLLGQAIEDVNITVNNMSPPSFALFLNPMNFSKHRLHCLKNGQNQRSAQKTVPFSGTVSMVSWKGFEPLTVRLEGGSSIQLSYQDRHMIHGINIIHPFQG